MPLSDPSHPATKFMLQKEQLLLPLFAQFDSDKNGFLSESEALKLARLSLQAQKEFTFFIFEDAVRAQYVDDGLMMSPKLEEDVKQASKQMHEHYCKEIDALLANDEELTRLARELLINMDRDHDGHVSKQEFFAGYLNAYRELLANIPESRAACVAKQ